MSRPTKLLVSMSCMHRAYKNNENEVTGTGRHIVANTHALHKVNVFYAYATLSSHCSVARVNGIIIAALLVLAFETANDHRMVSKKV